MVGGSGVPAPAKAGKNIRCVGPVKQARAASIQIAAESLEAIEKVGAREIAREESCRYCRREYSCPS